ncbi:MAG: alpha-L-fucosidase [Ignavibacteria bacterium]|nr:alpha-L-fucosidase [Ignavibacteria bacterium]
MNTRAPSSSSSSPCCVAQNGLKESDAQRDERMAWWREARFGMFIHWGVYAIPARGEWLMFNEKISAAEYEKLPPQFNPARFDADAWVRLAKEAGMKYIVVTSKHHDGFSMYDTKVGNYDIVDATPFKRDPMKELASACAKEGIRFCFYHSIMDWHHPLAKGKDFPAYRDGVMIPQLRELLSNYGPVGVLWFDGEWIGEWTEEQGRDLSRLLRGLQPSLIVNNRIGKGRMGMEGMSRDPDAVGDFGTPEQRIPESGIPGLDWESCMTMNDHWGYAAKDSNWKSARVLVRNLVDIASKGGNYLLNVGPTAEGLIPEESIARLKQIGAWMKTNSEAVVGTEASPFERTPWGRCTVSRSRDGVRLFLHVFDWPRDGKLRVPGLGTVPSRVHALRDRFTGFPSKVEDGEVVVSLPFSEPDSLDPVIVLEFPQEPVVYRAPRIASPSPLFLSNASVTLQVPSQKLSLRYAAVSGADTAWKVYVAPFTVDQSCSVLAQTWYNGRPVSDIVRRDFTKAVLRKGAAGRQTQPGWRVDSYEGTWSAAPQFDTVQAVRTGVATVVDLAPRTREEFFGLRFTGFLRITRDDVYTFSVDSDDGATLDIGGERVVDNDGFHGLRERRGSAALGRGLHAVELRYFNGTADHALALKMFDSSGKLVSISACHLPERPAAGRPRIPRTDTP